MTFWVSKLTKEEIELKFIEFVRQTTKLIIEIPQTLSAKFKNGKVTIGREEGKNDILIAHPSINVEANTTFYDDGRIEDNSTNSTLVHLKPY